MYKKIATFLYFAPTLALAQAPRNFEEVVGIPVNIINSVVYVLAGASLLVFLWGVATFILNSGNTNALEEGKNRMFWGIIGLFVLVSLWGIVTFVSQSIGL